MKTFYIASASDPENVRSVRRLAVDLDHDLQMEWFFDWTIPVSQEADPAKTVNPAGAEKDIEAAVNADLFVFLVTATISRGAHIELGARLAVGKEAHIVLRGNEPYFFYHHPLVTIHESKVQLLTFLGVR